MKTTLKNKLRSALHLENLLLILIMFCAGCAATPSSRAESLAADIGTDTNIAFSPDQIDFGFQGLETTSRVHTVTIRNDGQTPLVIEHLSVSAGFSIAENTCPQSPNAIASQGTCTVEVVFMPSSPKNWEGELLINYDSTQVVTMPLKGSAWSGIDLLTFS